MPPAVADFKLSITKALADQLSSALEGLTPDPLREDRLEFERRPGVYELYLNGRRVYVGKAKRSLPDRLEQHRRKLSGRLGLNIADVSFKCLYVDEDLDSASPERMLINAYAADGESPWNSNGFGNKDPGRNRDRTTVKAAHFDAEFSIDLGQSFALVEQDARVRLDQFVDQLKSALPYNLRREKKQHQSELRDSWVKLPAGEHDVRQYISLIAGTLGPEWQFTALPGYLILYRERAHYPSARFTWRGDGNGGCVEATGPRELADGMVPANEGDSADD